MKVLKKFITDGKTWDYEDDIFSDYDNLTQVVDHVVSFRGQVWEWQTYNSTQGQFEAELIYTLQRPNPMWATPQPTAVVGPELPFDIKCDCGGASVGNTHVYWCDVMNKDGWDEAFKYHEVWKAFNQIALEDQDVFSLSLTQDPSYQKLLKGIP